MARPALKKFTALPILIIALALFSAKGQEYNFRHLTTENGLPTNYTISVLKDSHGFIWIATRAGICRYDGYNMKVFQYDPYDSTSISDSQVTRKSCMTEDRAGNLWIATKKGLNRFDDISETFIRYHHHPDDPGSISCDKIYCLYTDRTGTLWIGTGDNGGLNRYNPQTDDFTVFRKAADSGYNKLNTIVAMSEDENGKFWIASTTNLFHFDDKNGSFTEIEFNTGFTNPSDRVFFKAICAHPSGKLFIGTSKGLLIFNEEIGKIVPFKPFFDENAFFTELDVVADPVDKIRKMWISGWNLYQLDLITSDFIEIKTDPDNPASIRGNMIFSLYGDRTRMLWITSEFGINILDPYLGQIHQHREFAKKYTDAMSFLEDFDGNTWIGTMRSLVKLDQEMNLIKEFKSFPVRANETFNGNIWCIYEDSDHNIWAGTEENGLFVCKSGEAEFIQCDFEGTNPSSIPVFIWKITEDSRSNLWICTFPYGLFVKKIGEKPLTIVGRNEELKSSLRNAQASSVYEDHAGNLWIATQDNGLFRQTPAMRQSSDFMHYRHYPGHNGSISSDRLWCIGEDTDNNLWVGSADGLNLYLPESDSFQTFKSEHNKGLNVIYNLTGDNTGRLWLTTESGLIRFDPSDTGKSAATGIEGSFKQVLPFNDIIPYVIYKSAKGRIFLGGSYKSGKGYYVFNPDSLLENLEVPPVLLVDFLVRGEQFRIDTSITLKKHLLLKHNQNFFALEFAALNYTAPELNQYRYMLEGLDESWNDPGSRRYANYTAVPPGKYIFRVKASNNDGYWNEAGASIAITIQEPPWNSWWARMLYILLLAGLIIVIIWYYLKRQQLRHALEIEHLQKEQLAELDQMKSRFFANISHEFRTPLTLILGPVNRLISRTADPENLKDLNIMQRNARRLQRLIDQLLGLSRIEAGKMKLRASEINIVPFVRGYFQSFESAARQKGISLVFNSDAAEIKVYVDRDKMEKVFYNLFSNALKFTSVGGKIKLAVDSRQSEVSILITDTGADISSEHLPFIFDRFYQADDSGSRFQEGSGIGLALAKEMVELHHGKINAESTPGEGTTFTIILLTGKDHLEAEEVLPEVAVTEDVYKRIDIIIDGEMDPRISTDMPANNKSPAQADERPVILLVEDNADMRYYIRSYLLNSYQLVEAGDGRTGWTSALETIPDLVISDIMMPGMDGYELCKKIKADERTSHIPVILLTAKAEFIDKMEGLETGADDFLTKPFQPEELAARTRNLITQRQFLREKFRKEFEHLSLKPEHSMTSPDAMFMERARKVVQQHLADPDFNIQSFSSAMNMSRVQLYRKLNGLFNLSATEFIRTYRLNAAARLLESRAGNVAQVAYEVGFNNLSYFSKCFQKQFGMKPSEFSKGARG